MRVGQALDIRKQRRQLHSATDRRHRGPLRVRDATGQRHSRPPSELETSVVSVTGGPSSKLATISSPTQPLVVLQSAPPTPLPLYAAAKSLQSCPTLCDPTDGSPPGSAVPGILQARTLEWVAISFSNA